MAEYKFLTPIMMVEDVKANVAFYCDMLGFDYSMGVADGTHDDVTDFRDDEREMWFASVKNGQAEIMFQTKKGFAEMGAFQEEQIGGSVACFIGCDNVDEIFEKVKDVQGVEIVKGVHDTWYGMREFYMKDPNGYTLGFAQRME